MDRVNITLESLLADARIRRNRVDGVWYFAQPDLNKIYEDVFRFLPATPVNVPSPSFYALVPCLSFADIAEQAEHWNNMPSFKDRVKQMFGKK